MKILHVTTTIRGGGVFTFLLSLAPEQIKLGHEVWICVTERYTSDYEYEFKKKLEEKGVNVVCLEKTRRSKKSLVQSFFKLRKLIKEFRPDIVNSHLMMPHVLVEIATRFSRATHCITIHSAPESWSSLCSRLNKKTPIIFCSHAAYELRAQNSPVMRPIDNGIAVDVVRTERVVDLRVELALRPTDRIVVMAGSLRDPKNYPFVKDVVKAIKDESIHICIAGDSNGPGYYPLEMFNDYPTVHTLGLRSDVSAIENGADVFLSCSLREGLPIAVLEAFFNGIPCVLSPISQHHAFGDGVSYCYFPETFDANQFAHLIKVALSVDKTHEEIYQERKLQLNKYLIGETAKEYIEFYESIKK